MSKQSDIQFYYFPFNLWIDSLIKIFVIISFTFLLVWSINPLYGIIVALILWSFLWNHFYNMINNLYRNLKGKPALELTETHIYDHINNTKIDWKNVKEIKLWESRGHTFICFNLKDFKLELTLKIGVLRFSTSVSSIIKFAFPKFVFVCMIAVLFFPPM